MSLLASIGSSLSGLMSSGSGGSLPLGDWSGGWTNYSSGQSKLKDALKRQYEYARSYAYSGPSWAVQGLRNAGLNPILAATDGSFSSPTLANPTQIGDGSGGSVSFSKMTKDENRRQEELQNSQLYLNKKQGELLDAQATKARVDADNAFKNRGLSGNPAVVSRIVEELKEYLKQRSNETGVSDDGSSMQRSSPTDNSSRLPQLSSGEKFMLHNSILPLRNESDYDFKRRLEKAENDLREKKAKENRKLPFTVFSR